MGNEPIQQPSAAPRRRRAAMTPERVRAAAEKEKSSQNIQNVQSAQFSEPSSDARKMAAAPLGDASIQQQSAYADRRAHPVQQAASQNRYQQPVMQQPRVNQSARQQ